ncbi:serine hydrolase [Mucilaginibacter sp. MD40]|uniref:serine hydrolase domain-containing protein n=1 Tax=Mucilaginibacter sp. MD40 TaxID=2029590 RepID=UPI000BACD075|nr:serine hydrolase domain-containing protein [Mucilaginibacter sp. MD40]PAW95624.1 serine hydrolase [Mucilaginibacter sp. MD40]
MKKGLLISALIFVTGTLSAQNNFSKVDEWFKTNTPDMGGRAVLVVYSKGKVVYSAAQNNLSRRQKMINRFVARRTGKEADMADLNADSRQPVASCSKWLSAALVMTFVDEGKIQLTDTVGKYLLALSKAGKGGITVWQCMSHTTAIKAPALKESLAELKDNNSMDDAIADIAAMPMEGAPGKVFHYSNVGLQIAGAILEKISGKNFETLFNERIATPLHMTNTDFGHKPVALPAGGAVSTANDYLKFLVMILNKGIAADGKRILSEQSIKQMQVNRLTADVKIAYTPKEAGGIGYGFGEWVMDGGNVSSPGLFGSYPVVNNNGQYAAMLVAYYFNNDGRGERYKELNKLLAEALK